MKKASVSIVLTLILVLLISATSLAAQSQNVVTVNPFGLLFGMFNANYELVQNNQISYEVGGRLVSYSSGDEKWSARGANIGMRFYQQEIAPQGAYVGPMAQVSYINAEHTNLDGTTNTGSGTSIGLGGLGGYQWILDGGFAIDLKAGGVYSFGSVTVDGETAPSVDGFRPVVGVNLGYAW